MLPLNVMTNGDYLTFAMVALRAITSRLEPTSETGILVSRVVDIVDVTIDIARSRGGLDAPPPPDIRMPDLPPRPWTPAGLLEWAGKQEFGTPPWSDDGD